MAIVVNDKSVRAKSGWAFCMTKARFAAAASGAD